MSGKLGAAEGMRIVQQGALIGLRRGMHEQAARMERTLRAFRHAIALTEDHTHAATGPGGPLAAAAHTT